jgi:hypothetical protein
MSDPLTKFKKFKKKITEEKDSSKKDKMKAKLELARKMANRKKTPIEQELQKITTQEKFDKDPISTKTDIIGDEMLSDREGSFRNGGLVKQGKPRIAKKGWR